METTERKIPALKTIPRNYLPTDFTVTDWASIEPFFAELRDREIKSAAELERWMLDRSELESVLSQDMGWRYIKMTCDTQNEEITKAFQFFVEEIEPRIAPFDYELNKKLTGSPYLNELDQEKYRIYLRSVKKALEIYREENIPLHTEISTKQQQYAAISGQMTVTLGGEEMTLQKAAIRLKDPDRAIREEAYFAIQERRKQDWEKLDNLYTELIKLRHQVALNAGFENYRDYMFAAMGRFDYTPQDTFNFHRSIAEVVTPVISAFDRERKAELGLPELKPWDLDVDPSNLPPLKPFSKGAELLEKSTEVFYRLDPFLGDCLVTMKNMGHLDLESRIGKAPGGYNYPLDETGVPFIFMNATSSLRDVVTMLHEGGHAVHSFLTRELPLTSFRHPPSEVAELASMSMELLTLEHWDIFFPDAAERKRAVKTHLEGVLETFPWVATIDKFQHWVYENPEHTLAERHAKWVELFDEFNQKEVSWAGIEQYKEYAWQKQLHLFEVPFYYVEYAMAQLGAVAVWKKFKENPEAGLEAYKNGLALGYTRSIGEIYEAAGVRFDFSTPYIKELVDFVKAEIAKL